jgi:subtilase family serine protease
MQVKRRKLRGAVAAGFCLVNFLLIAAVRAAESPVPSRIVQPIDETQRVVLVGNTYPQAQPSHDRGIVDPKALFERMFLVLQRSPEQQRALAAFNRRQYDPTSPDFHHWLSAEEFGRLYGPSDADVAKVTGWLQSQGFTINEVAKGRGSIQFTGTAAQVRTAFNVQMHRYLVDGALHIANDRDPQIPAALAPVVTGIASLHDFFAKPQMVLGRIVRRDRKTGKTSPLAAISAQSAVSPLAVQPQFSLTNVYGQTVEDLTPYDYATIYNILPLWNAGINGHGITIAISGVSDINAADFNNFRQSFGLPAATLNVIHNGTDPGADGGGGQLENTLDVEMAGATAPGATIDLVVSAGTATTGGDVLSDEYIIDNEVAKIMSASYGECELNLGTSGNALYNTIWQQGATEGISIFESSGDQGSAGCSNSDKAGPNADQIGLQVNGVASSPYLTAVGGTDFTWNITGQPISTYWNATNDAQGATAKGILPEIPWNSTCANPLLVAPFVLGGDNVTNTEQLCNSLRTFDGAAYDGLIVITGSSGGESHCTAPTGTTGATCSGGYTKPSWQTGPGVPADGKRDLPDVSLFASAGFSSGLNGSAILMCQTVHTATCNDSVGEIMYQEVGGTSASSPLMAGIMALVLQKTGAEQGLANPVLYALAQKQATAGTACNSSTVVNGNTCVFYDISQGTNSQVCVTGDPNCVTNTNGDAYGLLSGYAATVGYDQAVGLGSVNVKNLVDQWTSSAPTPTKAILWHNSDGATVLWNMRGATIASAPNLAVVPASWSIVGSGDFADSGGTDLLWRNSNGDVVIWLTNGTSLMSSVDLGIIPTSWTVAGTGDFNGDGKTDILWRNTNGDTVIWFMNGGAIASSSDLGVIPTSWSIAGTGDFNADAYTDILWRNTSGDTVIWFMDGAAIASSADLGAVASTWSIAGTGDFNGNGYSDILWHNGNGDTVIWFMNGGAIASSSDFGVIPTSWSIAGVAGGN